MKTCKVCGETKPTTEFSKDSSKTDGLNFYCRPCHNRRQAEFLLRPSKNSAVNGMKRCMRCKETKPVSNFGASTKTFDQLDRRCKACNYSLHSNWRLKNLDHAAAQQKAWRDNNPERARDGNRKSTYGVPVGWYAETLAAQRGGCAICGTTKAGGRGDFHVDHCHSGGKVRGLLCHRCNLMIGHATDDTTILESAIRYLTQHKQ